MGQVHGSPGTGWGEVCRVWWACRATGSSRHVGIQGPRQVRSSKTARRPGTCVVAALRGWEGTTVPPLRVAQGSGSEGTWCGFWLSLAMGVCLSQHCGVFGSDEGLRVSGSSCPSIYVRGSPFGTETCQSGAWGDAHKVLPRLFHMAIRGFLMHRVASVSWLCSRALREVFSPEDSRYVVVLGSETPSCCRHLHCSLP